MVRKWDNRPTHTARIRPKLDKLMYACEDGRGIIIPEVMVFDASGVGKRVKVRGVGDDVGGAG